MSHDGCHEVAWKGNAFPYLMHHSSFHSTENYGSLRERTGAAPSGSAHTTGHSSHGSYGHSPAPAASTNGESVFQAGTGTWNGPAPRGSRQAAEAAAAAAAAAPVNEPEFVRLSNGAKMPILGMGTAGLKSSEPVKQALALGYRHFDGAEFYGTEKLVGEGLKDFIASGKREELFIVSKLWNTHHRPEAVRPALEASLRDLGVEYVDLYLMHWPMSWAADTQGMPENPVFDTGVTIEQTWAAMEALVDAGLVKALGVSNFGLAQLEKLLETARVKPVVNQIELHPLLAQRKLVGVMRRKGVQAVAYSPLGGQSSFVQNDLKEQSVVQQVAKDAGKSAAQVLLKWNLQRGVVVIPKASSEGHLKDNLEGMFKWKLSNDQKALLDTLDCGKRYISIPGATWEDAEQGGVTKPSTVVF